MKPVSGGTVRIDLLGPLSLRAGGTLVTPTAAKPRHMLALLALNANRVVRNESMIDELWENSPPSSVTTTLQTYVYHLRKCLNVPAPNDDASGDPSQPAPPPLRTFAGGYMLSLEPGCLDSARFEELVQRGRLQLELGETAPAARTLREALQLWRGPALVDVNRGTLLQAEVLRLEEIRRSALELRIDADLGLGRHHEVLVDLVALVAQQPTHEGFQMRLILALYRAGRRAEALRAYQQARQTLIAELGIDPSGNLQRLHRAILVGDAEPSGVGPHQAEAGQGRPSLP
jgi:DNA-binding SARP family transcriptional activator